MSTVGSTRTRRVLALAGMLTAVAGAVGLRTALTPAPHQALDSPGIAVAAGSSGSTPSTPRPTHATRHAVTRVVGNAYDVGYGLVQVRVTITGARITDVTPMSLPQGGRSGDISRSAAPQLRREALSAQSAHIDTVSGASYTSAGYARSLQSALDRSGR